MLVRTSFFFAPSLLSPPPSPSALLVGACAGDGRSQLASGENMGTSFLPSFFFLFFFFLGFYSFAKRGRRPSLFLLAKARPSPFPFFLLFVDRKADLRARGAPPPFSFPSSFYPSTKQIGFLRLRISPATGVSPAPRQAAFASGASPPFPFFPLFFFFFLSPSIQGASGGFAAKRFDWRQ